MRKLCVFLFVQKKKITLPLENSETPRWVVGFLLEKETFQKKKLMEIVDVFVEHFFNNNDKPTKSSRMLRVKPKNS